MKKLALLRFVLSVAVLLGVVLVTQTAEAFAAERVWDGGGSDNKFSTAANWVGDTAPVSGDSISLPASAFPSIDDCDTPRDTVENDLNSGNVTITGLTVTGLPSSSSCTTGSSGSIGLTITGNTLSLSGDMSTDSSYMVDFNLGILVVGDSSFENVYLLQTVDIAENDVVFSGNGNTARNIVGSGSITISGYLGAYEASQQTFSGEVILTAGSYMTLHANSFAGDDTRVTVGGGELALQATTSGSSTMYSLAELVFSGGDLYIGGTLGGNVVVAADVVATAEVEVDLYNNLKFAGTVEGKEHFKIMAGGSGSITWPDNSVTKADLKVTTVNDTNKNDYCYESDWGLAVSVNNKYIWNIDCPQLSAGEESNGGVRGILAGTGRVGNITIRENGIIAPGESPGTLSTGNLTFEEGGIYELEVAGGGQGEYDQINVTGTVALGNGTLRVIPLEGLSLTLGSELVIINNDGSDAVSGTFANLPQGATIEVNGAPMFTISYTGGDGNDVSLVALPGAGNAGEESKNIAVYVILPVAAVLAVLIASKKFKIFPERR